MSQHEFSPQEIERLSREMDKRLNQLARGEAATVSKGIFGPSQSASIPQQEASELEKALAESGHDADSFWRRFQKAAREDICQEGGVLHAQWKKWGDLSNQKVIKQLGAILVAMGFSGGVLQTLALACGVIVVHIGVKAYCMETKALDSGAQ